MSSNVIIRNDSPQGALDVPLLGRVVDAGEEIEISVAQAERLLPQSIWAAVSTAAVELERELDRRDDQFASGSFSAAGPPTASANKGEWAAYAASRGLDIQGLTKPQLIAAVVALDAPTTDHANTGENTNGGTPTEDAGNGTNGDQS